ncbi:MAG: hypothetical protein NTV07_00975 [Candidatus Omnitrophica bacterium]|nr:hypothetical protein [Candidatus Omnitrophota bacterium]
MKKYSLAIISIVFILVASYVYCEEENPRITNGYYNGRYVMRIYEETNKTRSQTIELMVNDYILGLIDGMRSGGPNNKASELYPNCTNGDVIDAVKLYYKNNPTQRNRPVVDVLMSGCK